MNTYSAQSKQALFPRKNSKKKKPFTSFPELVECLNAEELQDIRNVVCKNDLVIIMMLDTIISPVIKASVIINKDLHLTTHIRQTKIDQLGKYKFPVKVNNTIVANEILHELALRIEMKSSHDFPTAFGFIVNLLENFEDNNKFPLLEANLSTLEELYDIESNNLVKFAYSLTLKAYKSYPTNLEKTKCETCA
ncbi:hypothetical protein TNCV_1152701 [Trichonephila clavipes]|nr:hypothetical protein TNCV_1152701 [Trichonephila clavipes]